MASVAMAEPKRRRVLQDEEDAQMEVEVEEEVPAAAVVPVNRGQEEFSDELLRM